MGSVERVPGERLAPGTASPASRAARVRSHHGGRRRPGRPGHDPSGGRRRGCRRRRAATRFGQREAGPDPGSHPDRVRNSDSEIHPTALPARAAGRAPPVEKGYPGRRRGWTAGSVWCHRNVPRHRAAVELGVKLAACRSAAFGCRVARMAAHSRNLRESAPGERYPMWLVLSGVLALVGRGVASGRCAGDRHGAGQRSACVNRRCVWTCVAIGPWGPISGPRPHGRVTEWQRISVQSPWSRRWL